MARAVKQLGPLDGVAASAGIAGSDPIVLTGSIAGLKGLANTTHYTAASTG